MKAILLENAQLTGFSSCADGGLRFRGVTPELSKTEAVSLMELHNLNVRLLIEPVDYEPESKVVVDKDLHSKTPSQRLRAIIFCQFRQQKPIVTFDDFYKRAMDRICEDQKKLLEPEHV